MTALKTKERVVDKALAELREKHPVWILRATDELYPPMAFCNASSMTQGEEKGR